jgi:CreA protein
MRYNRFAHLMIMLAAGLAALSACTRSADKVGEFKNDILGNEIVVEALADPNVPGIVCHFAHFDRGFWDRIGKGNWFEDPSNASIDCQRAGPIDLTRADLDGNGQDVFSQRQSLFFKQVAVRRIIDLEHSTVIYVVYSRELVEGSAKMSLSTVPLTPEEVAAARTK